MGSNSLTKLKDWWSVIATIAALAVGLGIAQQRIAQAEARMDVIEERLETRAAASDVVAIRQDITAIRQALGDVQMQASATNVMVGKICVAALSMEKCR